MSQFQHDVKFAEACLGGKIEVRAWARAATDEELRNAFDQVSPTNALTEILKVERDFRAARTTDARLLAVENGIRQIQVTLSRPEHKSWMFWLALTAAVFAILAVLRDYWNLQVPTPLSPAPVSSPANAGSKDRIDGTVGLPATPPPQ